MTEETGTRQTFWSYFTYIGTIMGMISVGVTLVQLLQLLLEKLSGGLIAQFAAWLTDILPTLFGWFDLADVLNGLVSSFVAFVAGILSKTAWDAMHRKR